MRTDRISPAGVAMLRRRWWLLAGLAALLFAVLVSRADAAVSVSYGLRSAESTVGSHRISFDVSKTKGSASASLSITIRKVDTRGTPTTADDVTQAHGYSFFLDGDAVQINDTLGTASIKTGALTPAAGRASAALNYGKLDLTFTHPGRITRSSGTCWTSKDRAGTWTGTFNFNSGLAGIGRVRRTSLPGEISRSTYTTPCTTPPADCINSITLFGLGATPEAGGSSVLTLFKSSAVANYWISFTDDSSDTAPATVTHGMTGPLPAGTFVMDGRLRTGRFDSGPIPNLDGVVNFKQNAPARTIDIPDCPDWKQRTGTLTGMIEADFAAGDDHTFTGATGTATLTKE